jgi:hypothetical protein
MKGCLFILGLAVAVLAVGLWVGAPPVAEALVTTGIRSAGVRSEDLTVDVRSDPPFELAVGRADRVVVEGSDVDWKTLRADTLSLTLDDVDLIGRSAARANGRLTGVELADVEPPGSAATVDIAGPARSATVTITFDRSTAEAIAAGAFEQRTGVRPTRTRLSAPDAIRFEAGPIDVSGAITVGPDGSLGVTTSQGRVIMLDSAATQPIHLTDVAVDGDELVLTGTLDVESVLR